MADGYGFGGEGDWKTSVLLRTVKVMADGLPGGTSFMEDYTYHLAPGEERILGAHMLEVCPSIAAEQADAARSTRWRSAAARTRSGWSSPPTPARRSSSASATWATGSGWWPTRSTSSSPTSRCRSCRWPARCGSRSRRLSTSAEAWLMAGGAAPHRAVHGRRRRTSSTTSPTMTGTELLVIDADTTLRGFQRELRWNEAYHRLAQGL